MSSSYADFYPQTLAAGGMFTAPTVEKFSVVVQRANEFFSTNHNMVPFACESCEQAINQGGYQNGNDMDRSCYFESGKHMTGYVRFLRVWTKPREASDPPPPVVLGCMTVLPGQLAQGGMFSSPKFEDYNTTILKINEMFRSNPIPGRILNVETQDMKLFGGYESADPEQSLWYESGRYAEMFINVIRIYYLAGPPTSNALGTVDFCPAINYQQRGMFGMNIPMGQPFSELLGVVNNWISSNPQNQIISVQSVNFKMDAQGFGSTGQVDTHRTAFYVSGRYATTYLRVLRLHFIVGGSVPRPITMITYRTFIPYLISAGGFGMPVFESMSETMRRAIAWLQHTGVRPIAAETVAILLHDVSRESIVLLSELSLTTASGRYGKTYLFCLRLYFDSPYHEPPPEVLPPAPVAQINQTVCCNLL